MSIAKMVHNWWKSRRSKDTELRTIIRQLLYVRPWNKPLIDKAKKEASD